MGLNSVIVCNAHQQCIYSMRGEEHVDIQQLLRSEHRECMKRGQVTLHCDCDIDHTQYEDFWPFEERPAAVGLRAYVPADPPEPEIRPKPVSRWPEPTKKRTVGTRG